jgi:hypothetical protein
LHPIEKLIPVLEQARLSTFSGFTFRVIVDQWRASPLSSIGALQRGGRYNPPREFTVLYTADSQFTALREVEALFLDEAGELRGVPRNPLSSLVQPAFAAVTSRPSRPQARSPSGWVLHRYLLRVHV